MNLFSILLGSMMMLTPTPAVADEPPPKPKVVVEAEIPPKIAPEEPQTYSTTTIATMVVKMATEANIDPNIALHVAKCESSLNPRAINDNPTTTDMSIGIYQINLYGDNAKSRPSKEWLLVPENNISYAIELYKSGGWNHWKFCYNKYLGSRKP
jgi:soluble lytic murein transglycosylase-like protein